MEDEEAKPKRAQIKTRAGNAWKRPRPENARGYKKCMEPFDV
jgi:hypothetical protein